MLYRDFNGFQSSQMLTNGERPTTRLPKRVACWRHLYIWMLTPVTLVFLRLSFLSMGESPQMFKNTTIPLRSLQILKNTTIPLGSLQMFKNTTIPLGSLQMWKNTTIPLGSLQIPLYHWDPYKCSKIPLYHWEGKQPATQPDLFLGVDGRPIWLTSPTVQAQPGKGWHHGKGAPQSGSSTWP